MIGKNLFICAGVFFFCLILYPSMIVQAQEKHDGWDWTRKHLTTTWMEWGEKYWPGKPVRGGTFRTASPFYIGLMNPNHWPVNDWVAIGLFYEGLTGFDGKYDQRMCWLQESFEFIDPTTLIMKVRRGVTFHDGSEYDAHAVKAVFDWIGDPKNGCWTRFQQDRIKSLEVLDKWTLKWTTHKPWGSFPQGFFSFMISPRALQGDIYLRQAEAAARKARTAEKKATKAERKAQKLAQKNDPKATKAEKKAAKYRKKAEKLARVAAKAAKKTEGLRSTDQWPVGTASYMMVDTSPGNYLKLKRNPNWWFGRSIGNPDMPYFDYQKITVIPDESIVLANLRAGKLDAMRPSPSQFRIVKNDPNLVVHTYPANTISMLALNHSKKILQDIRVRKAISHAIDRKALIAGIYLGLGREATGFWPDDHWAHNPELQPIVYDVELSKRLLREAGYPDGLELITLNYNTPFANNLGVAIKGMLSKVGINVVLHSLDPSAISDRMKNLEYDMNFTGDPAMQDPDASAKNHYHPLSAFNRGRSRNPKVLELLEIGRHVIDDKERRRVYQQLEEVLYNNYEDVWLTWGIGTQALRKSVQGWNNDMWIDQRTQYSRSHPLWFEKGHE